MDFIDDIKYKIIKDTIIVVLLLFLVLLNIFMYINKKESVVVNSDKKVALVDKKEVDSDGKCINDSKEIKVDVKGAVKQQGVYLLKEGDIVNDAIEAAGGITNKGVTKNINLSKKLQDQMVIYVYTNTELNNYKKEMEVNTKENVVKEECNCSSYEVSNCEGASIITSGNNEIIESNDNENNKININKASKEELLSLTGIGESKALAIIDYRNNNGLFKSIDDIKNVSGIGEALFAKIKENITI